MNLGLFFPRPAASGSSDNSRPAAVDIPPPASSQHSHQHPPRRVPPRNFVPTSHADARAQARVARQPKSPFVPKRAGKERDISACSIEELSDMLERSRLLLNSPHVVSALPGGDSKIKSQQARILSRLEELESVRQIKNELQKTHLVDDTEPTPMEDVEEDGSTLDVKPDPTLMGSSPRTKKRLMERFEMSTSPNSLMNAMSLTESIELQRQAVARDREAAEKRARAEAAKPQTGSMLKDAMKGVPAMSGFMFHADSDAEDDDDDFGLAEQQEEEEDREALNPYREAYRSGYERAVREGDGPPPVEDAEGS
ncbi:hypothetical protein RQP46_004830 [Phenoliferia psychrophenolica]